VIYLKQIEIKEYAESIGIEEIGFCDVSFSEAFIERLRERKRYGCLSGFEEQDEEIRIQVNKLLENASTIISIALPYRTTEPDRTIPYLSRSATGKDYHGVMKEKLNLLAEFIRLKYGGKSVALCDTSPLHDREIAYKCGIGFYGKNNNIINPKYGSFIFLGELVTDIYIERSTSLENNCGDCIICLKACPARALEKPYFLNAQKCLSYITQKKEQLTPQEIELSGCRVYGCDTCQDVCPYNKKVCDHGIREFEYPVYNPMDILSQSNRVFKDTFGRTSSGWRGKKVLTRNLINAMGNSGKKEYIKVLQELKQNKSELDYYIDIAIAKLNGK
jgi:epoxyqueuosine reductase